MVTFSFQKFPTSQPHLTYLTYNLIFETVAFVLLKTHFLKIFLTSSHLPCSTVKCCCSLELNSIPFVLHIFHSGNFILPHGLKYHLYLLIPKYVSPCQTSLIPCFRYVYVSYSLFNMNVLWTAHTQFCSHTSCFPLQA